MTQTRMKVMRIKIRYAAIAALALAGVLACARQEDEQLNEKEVAQLRLWLEKHYPEATYHSPGYYVLEETEGEGETAGDSETSPFVRVNYTAYSLTWTVSSTTDEMLARQLEKYSVSSYYGPVFWDRRNNALHAGLDAAIEDMKIGGKRTVLIPGWLATTKRYSSDETYIKKISGTHSIYTLSLEETVTDPAAWEAEKFNEYISTHFDREADFDTTGYYKDTEGYLKYYRIKEPTEEEGYSSGDKFYINYTGYRFDGQIFDTTIRDVAERAEIRNPSKSYTPVLINAASSFSEYTMTSSATAIAAKGFALALKKMKPYEKGIVVFTSDWGYYSSGSAPAIPSYSPMVFEIEIVDND